MKAKIYLETYERLYRQAQKLTDKIQQLEAQVTSSGAIRYDKDRVQHSVVNNSMNLVDWKIQLELALNATIEEMIQLKKDYLELFGRLVRRDREIAIMTWLDFESSLYISQRLHCTRQTVFNRRKAILMIIQEIIDNS